MTRFLAAWATQDALGCGVAPRTRIRRLACSMTASTYRRVPVKVTVPKKSQASSASAWERRKSAQVVDVRSGAGSIPACCRISQTVEAATLMPRTSSSPWMRRYPQDVFSRARRSTSRRMERTVRGRPGCLGRDLAAWRRASRSRCQRSTVSGRTSSRNRLSTSRGRACSRAARNARSPGQNRGRVVPSCAPAPRSGDATPGSPRPCPGRPSEAAAVTRTRSSHRDKPIEAAQPIACRSERASGEQPAHQAAAETES
jgi:hypothetical protein